jgi:RHS repeat-associated protein
LIPSYYYRVDYTYHPGSNLLYTVTDSVGNEFAAVTGYAPTGKIGHILYGNDVTTNYEYDGWSNRLTSIITNGPGGSPVLQDRSYGYTPAGDIELITDSVKSVSYYYEYDKLHRLISENTSDGSIGLTPIILELDYDNPDHIHAVSSATHWQISAGGGAQPFAYTYDFNGNLETGPDFTNPDAIADRTLAFNADNMPQQVAHTSSGTVNFLYDGEGKRAKKEGPAGTTYYLSNEIEVINGVPTCYIFAGNLRIAKVTEASITYFHKDHLGSSTVMTDSSGIALETGGYLPYGIQRENPGITLSNYRFIDQELDTESGLYNYDARLYDPVIGRFISPDSIVPRMFDSHSLNRYSYCRNNPMIYTDPTGHSIAPDVTDPDIAEALTAAAIAAGLSNSDNSNAGEDNDPDYTTIAGAWNIPEKGEEAEEAANKLSEALQEKADIYSDMLDKNKKNDAKKINNKLQKNQQKINKTYKEFSKKTRALGKDLTETVYSGYTGGMTKGVTQGITEGTKGAFQSLAIDQAKDSDPAMKWWTLG